MCRHWLHDHRGHKKSKGRSHTTTHQRKRKARRKDSEAQREEARRKKLERKKLRRTNLSGR